MRHDPGVGRSRFKCERTYKFDVLDIIFCEEGDLERGAGSDGSGSLDSDEASVGPQEAEYREKC